MVNLFTINQLPSKLKGGVFYLWQLLLTAKQMTQTTNLLIGSGTLSGYPTVSRKSKIAGFILNRLLEETKITILKYPEVHLAVINPV